MFVELNQSFFEAGTNITGSVFLLVSNPFPAEKLKVKVKGMEKVHWVDIETKTKTIQNPDGTYRYEVEKIRHDRKSKCKIFEIEVKLFDINGTFNPGQYSFPFMIPTNQDFPGTICIDNPDIQGEFCLLKRCIVEYSIGAKLDSSDNEIKDLSYKGEFIIRQKLPPLLMKDSPTNLSFQVTKCFCCKRGGGALSAYIDRNNYALNEVINVLLMADNSQSEVGVNGLEAKLYQYITLRAGSFQRLFCEIVGGQRQEILLPKGTKMTEPAKMSVTASKNPYRFACKGYGENVMNHATMKGRLIECSYNVVMNPTYDGCCVSGGEIRFPINLYAPQLDVAKFVVQGGWAPQVYQPVTIQVPAFSNMIVMQ